MLTDRGIQTPEQIKAHKEFLDKRAITGMGNGCIGERICESCNHLISDSICLCIGYFICPNCNFENGKEIKELNEKARNMSTLSFVIQNPNISSDNKDTARLNKLENYLADYTKNISGPSEEDSTWQFGYNFGEGYEIEGTGNSLREAIDSLPKKYE